MKLLNYFVLLFVLFIVEQSFAKKISANFGIYNIATENTNGSSLNLTRLGNYQIVGHFPLNDRVELDLGYSVFFSRIITGDMGFGPDLWVNYFFRSAPSRDKLVFGDQVSVSSLSLIRPFAGIGFHQRQFQSTQTSFSGFGLVGGLEWMMTPDYSLVSKLNIQDLVGPNRLGFRYIDVTIGIQMFLD